MALEPSVVNISDLNKLWPLGADPASISDDNHRNIKTALLNDFAGFTGAIKVTGVDGGLVNAYTLTPTNTLPAYSSKMTAVFAPTIANTGACTLEISSLGPKSLKSVSGADLINGDLIVGNIYTAFYNGTEWRLLSTTKNYVDQLAFSPSLPAQPAGAYPRYLTSVSSSALWAQIPLVRVPRTANTVIDASNNGNLIDFTANTFTQTFSAVASLPPNFYCYLQNSGTGDITLDPNGAETIDGLASYVMYPGEVRLFYKDETGLLLKTIKLRNFYRSTIANFTYIHPPGYDAIESDMVAGGGGGGSGSRGAVSTSRPGGAPGGTPSRKITRHINLIPGNSYPVVVGANGVGGAAITVNSTSGNAGTAGGNSTFNGFTAFGGCAGLGAIASNNYAVTSGSGSLGAGSCTNIVSGGPSYPSEAAYGGLPSINRQTTGNATAILDATGEGGGTSFSGSAGGNSVYGGGASNSSNQNTTTVITSGGHSQYGVPAAGQGGWITAGDAMPATAGYAGLRGTWTGTGTIGGTCGGAPTAGTNGTAATNDNECGTSGSGGGSSITVAAAAGGNGGFPGGAGGGGGASLNGNNSGKGADGAAGRTILKGI